MKVQGNQRRIVQKVLENTFNTKTGQKLKWQRGEKQRIVKIFATLCHFMDNKSDFNGGVIHFEKYVGEQIRGWLTWSKRDRGNLLGFIANQDAMRNFSLKMTSFSAQESSMTGVGDTDKWDDF